ncbi:MAG: mobile mystery protein A [Chlorobiales bacterium]|nr:mobile mystery protein A [Chlorobiales bacterium]
MNIKSLQLQQLNNKMLAFASLKEVAIPPSGWVKAIRTALGISMLQLGKKLSITKQAVHDIERREKEGSITIKSMIELGRALDMRFVYGFVPNDGSLDALIEKKATELASIIVLRSSNTMKLEDQGNSELRIMMAIKERAAVLKKEMPKILWD